MFSAREGKTIFPPQTTRLVTLTINRRGKTIKVAFHALYLPDNAFLGKPAGFDTTHPGDFADFLHVHNRILLPFVIWGVARPALAARIFYKQLPGNTHLPAKEFTQ